MTRSEAGSSKKSDYYQEVVRVAKQTVRVKDRNQESHVSDGHQGLEVRAVTRAAIPYSCRSNGLAAHYPALTAGQSVYSFAVD